MSDTNKIWGYVRVSTPQQMIGRQVDNILRSYPDAEIIKDTYTGTTTDRPGWNRLEKRVQSDDVIIFDEVSRMSRNAAEGFALYQALFDKGIHLIFLKEPHLNTDVYRSTLENQIAMTGTDVDIILQGVNQYLMILAKKQIEIAFERAQQEIDYLHKRTSEGIRKAQRDGKIIGRKTGTVIETAKAKAAKEIIRKHCREFGGSLNDEECRQLTGTARNSFYKYKRQIREEQAVSG